MAEAFERYVKLAGEDLDAARQLVRDARHTGRAAFFVQQAGEKLIKAVLSVERIRFPTTHHLGMLAGLLPEDHEWRAELGRFDAFTSFATRFRYPRPGGSLPELPGPDAVGQHIDEVAAIVDDLLDWCRDTALKRRPGK